jgi:hypothetical protein
MLLFNDRHFPLGNSLNASCMWGNLNLTTRVIDPTTPLPPPNQVANMSTFLIGDPSIRTKVGTGSTLFRIESPFPSGRRIIKSSHVGVNGTQRIYYPSDWEGIAAAQVNDGLVRMRGLSRIIEQRNVKSGKDVFVKAHNLEWHAYGYTEVWLKYGSVIIGVERRPGPRNPWDTVEMVIEVLMDMAAQSTVWSARIFLIVLALICICIFFACIRCRLYAMLLWLWDD